MEGGPHVEAGGVPSVVEGQPCTSQANTGSQPSVPSGSESQPQFIYTKGQL